MNCKPDDTWLGSDVAELLESVTLELDLQPLDLRGNDQLGHRGVRRS